MSTSIRIPDDIFARLQALAVPLVDTPATVIARLLDARDRASAPPASARSEAAPRDTMLPPRSSRQSGVIMRIEDTVIKAGSVSDLFDQILSYIVRTGRLEALLAMLPIATSRKRYLAARTKTHPSGRPFVVPVQRDGIVMEAHKSYETAIRHVAERMLNPLGISWKVVE